MEEVMQKKFFADHSVEDPTDSGLVTSKDGSASSDEASRISSAGDGGARAKVSDVDHYSDPLTVDHSVSHPASKFDGYWHQGYGGTFLGPQELEFQYPVMQADNGSFVYLMPGVQPGYCTYFPVNTVGVDGQYVGQDSYSPSHLFHPSISCAGYYPGSLPFEDPQYAIYQWESPLVVDAAVGSDHEVLTGSRDPRPKMVSKNYTGSLSKPLPQSGLNHSFVKKSPPLSKISSGHMSPNKLKPVNNKTLSCGSTLHSDVLVNSLCPVADIISYDQEKNWFLYPNSLRNTRENYRAWSNCEKLKMRSKSNGFLNEQNQGPRIANVKGEGNENVGGQLASNASTDNGNKNTLVHKDDYNQPDFPTKYEQAFFFVIKSYSEDDIHKSIKYNVWTSTPNGNKKLDATYRQAEEWIAKKGCSCPVFLFFSVNASGQFCGVAEMTGLVNFEKTTGFWQQDKWKGCFPVKWHIIKDVPNPHFRHIVLENNENKPVTNSRDTQEVKFPKGIEMLNIFKNYVSRTSILDDFEFYENREKVMQAKRIREFLPDPTDTQSADDLADTLGSVSLSTMREMSPANLGTVKE